MPVGRDPEPARDARPGLSHETQRLWLAAQGWRRRADALARTGDAGRHP